MASERASKVLSTGTSSSALRADVSRTGGRSGDESSCGPDGFGRDEPEEGNLGEGKRVTHCCNDVLLRLTGLVD